MDPIFDEKVDYAEMEKIQKKFLKEKEAGVLTPETRFSYAWCLVRCKSNTDVNNGIKLLEQLFKEAVEEDAKRDYLYYVAFGYTRIREYGQALKFTKAILEVQPQNHQVKALKDYIEKKTKKDGLIGLAVVGGAAAVALGGIIGLGVALSKK